MRLQAFTFFAVIAAISSSFEPTAASEPPVFLSRSFGQIERGQATASDGQENPRPATRPNIARMLADAGLPSRETVTGFEFEDRRLGQNQVRTFEIAIEPGSLRLIMKLNRATNAGDLSRSQMNALMQANVEIAPFSFTVNPAVQELQLESRIASVTIPTPDFLKILDSAAAAADRTATIWQIQGPEGSSPQTVNSTGNVQTKSSSPPVTARQPDSPTRVNSAPWWRVGKSSGQRSILIQGRKAQLSGTR